MVVQSGVENHSDSSVVHTQSINETGHWFPDDEVVLEERGVTPGATSVMKRSVDLEADHIVLHSNRATDTDPDSYTYQRHHVRSAIDPC